MTLEDLVIRSANCDNRAMDLTQEQIDKLEAALTRLRELDPAALPEPAAELADLLGSILEESETT